MQAAPHPDLKAAEDGLKVTRAQLDLVAGFIHDPAYDRDARIALARLLSLPAPRTNETRKDTENVG
jgi:hypothetical protein